MRASIEVLPREGGYEVTVNEGMSRTRHAVRASADELHRLAPGYPPERIIEAAFRFLLDREPKESILARFDLPVISRYFPEFESRLADYLRERTSPPEG